MTQDVLERLRNVPTRAGAALFTFGGMLGVPGLLGLLGGVFLAFDLQAAGLVFALLSFVAFLGFVVTAWVLIFGASSRLKRAELALYAGDFDTATREARFVARTVFRSDYQTGALFTLALSAERLGAFPEAAALFTRALDMIPAMAAKRPGTRARALFCAHAALDFAAANDPLRASQMLARCQALLGAPGQPGALEGLLDDSGMGAIGINTILVELENRREPRPLAVLAWMLATFKAGQPEQVLHALQTERMVLAHGLAAHEQELARRIEQLCAGAPVQPAQGWSSLVLGA